MNGVEYSKEYIKARTQEIYDSMPQEKNLRMNCLKERDELITLNYTFFGYIASHTFVNNSYATYEDKLQSAISYFCQCFWWYKWNGDETHKGYRSDLAFSVFFKPRIGEMLEREFNEVKYSTRRALCMEVGEQLGKHWGQVKYEDLSDPRVHIDPNKMIALKAIFGSLYVADLDTHSMFMASKDSQLSEFEDMKDTYNSIEDFLIHEMVEAERKLTDTDLLNMAEMYSIDYLKLKVALPKAEKVLHQKLLDSLDMRTTFENDGSENI